MTDRLEKAKDTLLQELGQLSSFVGFNKAMGQIYGILYLSREPVSLGEIAEQLGISKGNASLNIKTMVRWGLVRPISKKGDRRDYYLAETDFWKIIHDIMTEREGKQVDHILNALGGAIASIDTHADQSAEADFYRERLQNMLEFGNVGRQMMKTFLTVDNFRTTSLSQSQSGKAQTSRIEIED